AGIVRVERHGRARLASLADDTVAEAVEALLRMSAEPEVTSWTASDRRLAMRLARSCYDHLAGDLGIAVTDHLVDRGFIDADVGSVRGPLEHISDELGLPLTVVDSPRPLVRGCLDWTARRPHAAGR